MSLHVSVTSLNKKGEGIAVHPDTKKSIEIVHTFPGDEVRVLLKRKNKRVMKGRLEEIIVPSPDRITLRCPHALLCGGCIWQGLQYEKQLFYKQQIMEKLFVDFIDQKISFSPIVPAKNTFFYRNKMEFSFSENRANTKFLGLTIAKSGSYVFNLEKCFLGAPFYEELVQVVRAWWHQFPHLKAYDPPSNQGTLRTLIVREGKNTGQKMVILTVSGDKDYAIKEEEMRHFISAIQSVLDSVSIYLLIVQNLPGKPTQTYEMHLAGPTYIEEKFMIDYSQEKREFVYKISPSSFFQPSMEANTLYNLAIRLGNPSSQDSLLDLYSGTGTLGLTFAPLVKQVVGMEINPYAVFDAKVNMEKNRIENMTMLQGNVTDLLQEFVSSKQYFDFVIVDPPRAGLGEKTIADLLSLRPATILYISCNPYTQIEDVRKLTASQYQLTQICPVDQFPHTPHIENICVLKLT